MKTDHRCSCSKLCDKIIRKPKPIGTDGSKGTLPRAVRVQIFAESPLGKEFTMIRRLICLLCILALCLSCAAAEEAKPAAEETKPVSEETKPVVERYDFDLTFSLNPDALPARSRLRARGYSELLDRLELRGDLVVCEATESFEINATLFFRDKPDVSIPFSFYGTEALLFLTSPIIGNETILFNMGSIAEFAIKIRKSLETPLPALALLYPFVYYYNFYGVNQAWEQHTGPNNVSREISAEKIEKLSEAWSELLASDPYLNVWMTALYSVSSAPEAVEAELNAVPSYLREFVSAGGPLTVEIGDGTETWTNAEGTTLFARETTDHSVMWSLTLPADENRYTPTLDYSGRTEDGLFSFNLDGSMIRGRAVLPPGMSEEDFSPVTGGDEESGENIESESGDYPLTGSGEESEVGSVEESSGEEEEDSSWPETMVIVSVSGDSIPTSLPCDSSFSLKAAMNGALYPNFDFTVNGKTEKDGSVSVSLLLPQEGADPATVLTCKGTVVPSDTPVDIIPNYYEKELNGNFNFFSFSEYALSIFKSIVTKPLIKGMLDFVAEAPTASVQSLLDDLTDAGILNMMMTDQ